MTEEVVKSCMAKGGDVVPDAQLDMKMLEIGLFVVCQGGIGSGH